MAAFHSTFRHVQSNFPQALPLGGIPVVGSKCVSLHEVDKGRLYGQTLDPSILMEGARLECAAVPIPGLSIAVDLAIIAVETEKYCHAIGLDKESLEKLCERYGRRIETVESLIKSAWYKGICTGSIITILRDVSFLITEDAVESVVRFVPILGAVVAGAMSFWAVSTMLKSALNDIAEDVRNVLMGLLETEV